MKPENKNKLNELIHDEELNESDASSTRYVTTADLSIVNDTSQMNGRLSFHTSLPSQRRSLSSTINSRHSNQHQNCDENDRRSNASSRNNRRSDMDEVFNDLDEAF